MKKLAFRFRLEPIKHRLEDNEVFVGTEASAEEIDAIYRALESSKTWGEFKLRMPPTAYADLMKWAFDEDGRQHPRETEPFSPEQVPNYEDGDYPAWPKHRIRNLIPADLLLKHAIHELSAVSGDFWTIPARNWPGLKHELQQRGYEVVERSDLIHFR